MLRNISIRRFSLGGGFCGVYCWWAFGRDAERFPHPRFVMTLSLILWMILPVLVLIALIDLTTASPARRARILRRAGLTQQAIADRMGVSRYRVRQYLAA